MRGSGSLSAALKRDAELRVVTSAGLRALAMRLGKAFRTPRTEAERRELRAWIITAEAKQIPETLRAEGQS